MALDMRQAMMAAVAAKAIRLGGIHLPVVVCVSLREELEKDEDCGLEYSAIIRSRRVRAILECATSGRGDVFAVPENGGVRVEFHPFGEGCSNGASLTQEEWAWECFLPQHEESVANYYATEEAKEASEREAAAKRKAEAEAYIASEGYGSREGDDEPR